MLKIILYCSQMTEFEKQKAAVLKNGFAEATFVFGNSAVKTREQLINENLNSWLLFLDHDCIPDFKSQEKIQSIVKNAVEKPVAYAGFYSNPQDATTLQKVHNKIANTWLEQSYSVESTEPLLLGGIFIVAATHHVTVPQVKFWGAEDKLLAEHLRRAGYSLQILPGLIAIHDTNRAFRHFVKRAILHGRHEVVYFNEKKSSKTFYWMQKIDFLDWRLAPLILLHFCIQKGATAFQKALPKNKQ